MRRPRRSAGWPNGSSIADVGAAPAHAALRHPRPGRLRHRRGRRSPWGAAGALLDYARTTQQQALRHVTGIRAGTRRRVPAAGCRHAAQPGDFRNPARRAGADPALAARHLRHRHGLALAAPRAASPDGGTHAIDAAPRGGGRADRRSRRRPLPRHPRAPARHRRRRTHHRARRAEERAPARSRQPARFASSHSSHCVPRFGQPAAALLAEHRARPAAAGRRTRSAGARGPRGTCRAAARRRRDRRWLRRRPRRTARHPVELRRLPARTRNARTQPHRHRQPARRVQPRARLLHRGHATPTPNACPTTTGAARR